MANGKSIHLVVITPERQVLEAQTASAVIPAHDGELGVLSQRAPLMCELGVGQLRYELDGRTHRVLIDGGFAQVHNDELTVLTNRAIPSDAVTDDLIAAERTVLDGLTGTDPDTLEAQRRCRQRLSVMSALRN